MDETKQSHNYWTKHSYVAIPNNQSANVKRADDLLPEEFCIIPVKMLDNIDANGDLLDRANLAEARYHQLKEKYNNLIERYNLRDHEFEE